jgi:hypothetical protein
LRRAATIKAGSIRFSNRCGAAGGGFGNVWNLSPKIKRVASGSRTGAAQPEEDFVAVRKLSPKISTLSGPLEFFSQSAREGSLHRFLAADLIPRKLVTRFSDVIRRNSFLGFVLRCVRVLRLHITARYELVFISNVPFLYLGTRNSGFTCN